MLAYFPAIYPGELLYSVLARLYRHLGGTQPMDTMNSLFGTRVAVASPDLPGHLQAFAARLPPDRGLTPDRIIDELTLFPYYTAFEPPAVQRRARRAMVEGCSQNLHLRLGVALFRVGRVTTLRFCRRCLTEMRRDYGEWYWRRDHQLAGTLVCPDHGCALQESTVSLARHSRHEFIAAVPTNCPSTARPLVCTSDIRVLTHLERLAQQSRDLLIHPIMPRSFRDWTHFYREQLIEVGLAHSSHKMDQVRLHQEFLGHYGDALQHLPNVLVNGVPSGGWLAAIVRRHRKAIHPMYHLLLQEFLRAREARDSPFGSGPWPCLNPLSNHYLKRRVKTFSYHRNHGKTVGVFACECGYVFTRCYDTVTRKLGAPRFQAYGHLLEPALRRMLNENVSLRETARRLQIDPMTVISQAQRLGITVPWSPRLHRKSPATVKQAGPCQKRSDANAKAVRSTVTSNKSRRDWPTLDREWAARITASAVVILKSIPPVRITLAELERRCGVRGWLSKRRKKLPRTNECVVRYLETVDAFQLRRIHWAIFELEQRGRPVRAWRVMRMAGLPTRDLPRIRLVLNTNSKPRRRVA